MHGFCTPVWRRAIARKRHRFLSHESKMRGQTKQPQCLASFGTNCIRPAANTYDTKIQSSREGARIASISFGNLPLGIVLRWCIGPTFACRGSVGRWMGRQRLETCKSTLIWSDVICFAFGGKMCTRWNYGVPGEMVDPSRLITDQSKSSERPRRRIR